MQLCGYAVMRLCGYAVEQNVIAELQKKKSCPLLCGAAFFNS
jgi:hypothetical protein